MGFRSVEPQCAVRWIADDQAVKNIGAGIDHITLLERSICYAGASPEATGGATVPPARACPAAAVVNLDAKEHAEHGP